MRKYLKLSENIKNIEIILLKILVWITIGVIFSNSTREPTKRWLLVISDEIITNVLWILLKKLQNAVEHFGQSHFFIFQVFLQNSRYLFTRDVHSISYFRHLQPINSSWIGLLPLASLVHIRPLQKFWNYLWTVLIEGTQYL